MCLLLLVMQERAFKVSLAEDTRTPWLTRKPTDMAAVARTPITTDLLACLTNTEHPPFCLRGLCCGACGQGLGFFIPRNTEVAFWENTP